MRALRSAAALLRGAAGLALAPHRVLAAGAGAQAAAELARRLDQGCAARHASTAAGDEPGLPLRGTIADVPVAPKRRAPNVGKLGEKTADGKPKPDERTVEDLVRRGWFESEEDAVALLTRMKSRKERFPYETAKPAADWLEATLGLELLKGGVLRAAKAVIRFPALLCQDAATLQRNWVALMLPVEQGGAGIAFSPAQAREAFLKDPPILGYATDTLKRGWSMLTATAGGLGLSPDEARSCILRSPAVLRFDHDAVVRRVELLKSLGYPKAYEMVLKQSRVLSFTEECVRERDAWWKQTGLDHIKIVESQPNLLGLFVDELRVKLDFLSCVAGMTAAELNRAGNLFTNSLDDRLRARYFYALLKGRLARFTSMNTMFKETDATFLAMLQNQPYGTRASELEVARYDKLVKSAKFVAWRERQEARRLAAAPPPARDHA
jgi:hypothetical protein